MPIDSLVGDHSSVAYLDEQGFFTRGIYGPWVPRGAPALLIEHDKQERGIFDN